MMIRRLSWLIVLSFSFAFIVTAAAGPVVSVVACAGVLIYALAVARGDAAQRAEAAEAEAAEAEAAAAAAEAKAAAEAVIIEAEAAIAAARLRLLGEARSSPSAASTAPCGRHNLILWVQLTQWFRDLTTQETPRLPEGHLCARLSDAERPPNHSLYCHWVVLDRRLSPDHRPSAPGQDLRHARRGSVRQPLLGDHQLLHRATFWKRSTISYYLAVD